MAMAKHGPWTMKNFPWPKMFFPWPYHLAMGIAFLKKWPWADFLENRISTPMCRKPDEHAQTLKYNPSAGAVTWWDEMENLLLYPNYQGLDRLPAPIEMLGSPDMTLS